jgi:hypothetical protein
VLLAEKVSREALDWYVSAAVPDRPVDMPGDETIYLALLAVAHRAKPPRDEMRIARDFGRWRSALAAAETRSLSKLAFLVGCWEDLREASSGDAALTLAQDRIRAHVERLFPRVDLDKLPSASEVAPRELFLQRAVREEELMPSWLMHGQKPPNMMPAAYRDHHESDPVDNAPRAYKDD